MQECQPLASGVKESKGNALQSHHITIQHMRAAYTHGAGDWSPFNAWLLQLLAKQWWVIQHALPFKGNSSLRRDKLSEDIILFQKHINICYSERCDSTYSTRVLYRKTCMYIASYTPQTSLQINGGALSVILQEAAPSSCTASSHEPQVIMSE